MDIAVADVNLDSLRVQVEGLDLEEKIGSGAYGVVYGVTVNGKKCAAKKLHNILLIDDDTSSSMGDSITRNFHHECCLMSQLKHPNVVGFVGVHIGRERNNIILIMERLHCNLADYVKTNPHTPLCDRLHILHDVSKGVDYLHSLTPPLMHCDLTAFNILLTEDLTAKIEDFSMSSYVDPTGTKVLTSVPGNGFYMPPESRIHNPTYTTKLDIFSFGVLILHTITGYMPHVDDVRLIPQRYIRKGMVELKRRNIAAGQQMGESHCLYPLVVRCLHDKPDQRLIIGEVRIILRRLCAKHPQKVVITSSTVLYANFCEDSYKTGA